jgi:hypothetical protein
VAAGVTEAGVAEFAQLMSGDSRLKGRLALGERLCVATPFRYPGRRGAVTAYLTPCPLAPPEPRKVIISDGGGLIKSLDEQGLDLAVDLIVSKTVFHAVKDVPGANIGSGELYVDSTIDELPADLWRFLQLMTELVGLRHSKYKDALLHMSRRGDSEPDLINW